MEMLYSLILYVLGDDDGHLLRKKAPLVKPGVLAGFRLMFRC